MQIHFKSKFIVNGNLYEQVFFVNFAGKINEMTTARKSRKSFEMHSQKLVQNGSYCLPAYFFFRYTKGNLSAGCLFCNPSVEVSLT